MAKLVAFPTDYIPPLDDTYWLGDNTRGWKGLKFPDIKLYQSDANTLSLENIAGGTYKHLKMMDLALAGGATALTFTNAATIVAAAGVTLPAVTLGGVVTAYAGSGIVRTTTKVVAASDADATVKLQADYVCDGTADDIEIQAVIDAMSSGDSLKVIGKTLNFTGYVTMAIPFITVDIEPNINLVVNSGFKMGKTTVPVTDDYGMHLILHGLLDGQDKVPIGIDVINANYYTVDFSMIQRCDRGIRLNAATGYSSGAGTINGNLIYSCDVGIELNAVDAGAAQGMFLNIGFIASCVGVDGKGLWLRANCPYLLFYGGLDYSTTDLQDDVGQGIFILDYAEVIAGAGLTGSNRSQIIAAYTTDYQPLYRKDYQAQSFTNLLNNGNFEVGDPSIGWALVGAGATAARSAAQKKIDSYSVALTRVDTDLIYYQSVSDYVRYKGKKVTLGAWVYATVANRARLNIGDGVAESVSIFHSGVAGWEWLTITKDVAVGAVTLNPGVQVVTGNTTAYVDGMILVEGEFCPAFSSKPRDDSVSNSGTATVLNGQVSIKVTHGLAAVPTRILVTPTSLEAVTHWWISSKDSDADGLKFTITVDQDPAAAGGAIFDWRAQVGEG